jgi:squalene-associated FAD-dependent desaturase
VNGAPRIAVVGGGLAGLAAALECADGGAEVTLYEARQRLGGATFSVERHGHWIDNGQHILLRCCVSYGSFLHRLGVERLVAMQPRLEVRILREGQKPAVLARGGLPAPLHLAGAILGYAPLSVRERVAALRAGAALRRLDSEDPELDRMTFGDWLREHGQSPRAIDRLWNLIALPTMNVPADEASLAQAVQVFRTGLLDTANAADIGLSTVPLQQLHGDAASAALAGAGARVVLGAPVRSVEREVGGVRLVLDEGAETAHAVIAAVPHTAADELLPPGAVDPEALARLGEGPIVNLHVHYDRRVLPFAFAAALDSPVQWLFDRTAASGVELGQLVVVSLSDAQAEIGETVAAIRERYLPALARLLPAADEAEVLDFAVTHEPRATFRPVPGTRALRPTERTEVPGVYLAGAWTATGWPATMEGAVRSGVLAARAALSDLAVGAPAPEEALAS